MRLLRIAGDEWRLLSRNRVASIMTAIAVTVTLLAAVVAWHRQQAIEVERERYQYVADERFENQPDRHPHRVVHYGHFLFRPLAALAAFDPGIEPLVGHMIYLEGHRQNSANFSDARQSSLLIRFGEFTPAFVVQTLVPLLLIFVGFGAVARERAAGTLRLALAQGVSPLTFVTGKWLALIGVSLLATAPALLTLLLLSAEPTARMPALLAGGGYLLYLIIWAGIVVLVSALAPQTRGALLGLIALWTLLVIVLPRGLPEIASAKAPLPTRFETDIAIDRDLAAIGDSHNPDDPYFAQFRKKVLQQYGVERVEDLPINYRGLIAVEGERITSELFEKYAAEAFALLRRQNAWVESVGSISPLTAIRRLSMTTAETDLEAYRSFLAQAEAHRFQLVQALNRMQAELLSYAKDTDSRANRVDAAHFRELEAFRFQSQSSSILLERSLSPLLALFVFALAVFASLALAARRLAGGATR